jgi:hypothetical protein
MTLHQRYINGQTEAVYQDIAAMEQAAFLPKNLPDVEAVLTETFERVAFNLGIIYTEPLYLTKLYFNNMIAVLLDKKN